MSLNSSNKIVFIENEDINRDSSGGVMSYIINLSSYFRSQDYKTSLIGSGKTKSENISKNKFSEYYSISDSSELNNLKFLLKLFRTNQLRQINKDDVIHVQRAEMVIPLSLRKRNKIICTLHGGQDLAVLKKKGRFMAFFYSILQYISFIMVDELIVVDKKNLERYIEKHPWIKNKISLIPISVDINRFHQKNKLECRRKFNLLSEKKILLFIGRLEYEKNIEFIIESFKEMDNSKHKLLIVGAGSLSLKLKEMAASENYDIEFLGEVDNSYIPELINSSDLLVLTSFFEGSPTVVKEALCCNVPVLSTNVGDVKEVLQLVSGGKIIDYTTKSFISAVDEIFTNNKIDLPKTLKLFSHTLMGERTLSIYNHPKI